MSDVGGPLLLLLPAMPLLLAARLAGRECIITLSRPRIVIVFPVPAAMVQGAILVSNVAGRPGNACRALRDGVSRG